MRAKPGHQLPLGLDLETVDLPLEVLDEARRLLVELLLAAGRGERGGTDERQDPSDAPRT
jgi:hypothetical protein